MIVPGTLEAIDDPGTGFKIDPKITLPAPGTGTVIALRTPPLMIVV